MVDRNEVVTNGCGGGCCAKFTLPVTINDLQRMKRQHNNIKAGKQTKLLPFISENGYERRPVDESEVDKLLDMLISLGATDIDPQHEKPLAEVKEYDETIHTDRLILDSTYGHVFVKDYTLFTYIFTCKYFDAVNRLCTNYENRPNVCKDFGDRCCYKGCNYAAMYKQQKEAEYEARKTELQAKGEWFEIIEVTDDIKKKFKEIACKYEDGDGGTEEGKTEQIIE